MWFSSSPQQLGTDAAPNSQSISCAIFPSLMSKTSRYLSSLDWGSSSSITISPRGSVWGFVVMAKLWWRGHQGAGELDLGWSYMEPHPSGGHHLQGKGIRVGVYCKTARADPWWPRLVHETWKLFSSADNVLLYFDDGPQFCHPDLKQSNTNTHSVFSLLTSPLPDAQKQLFVIRLIALLTNCPPSGRQVPAVWRISDNPQHASHTCAQIKETC